MIKVEYFKNRQGKTIPNQLIVREITNEMSGNGIEYFQSYGSVIAMRGAFEAGERDRKVTLDVNKWDYSTTTGKYRNQFLGETKAETERKIKSGEYTLADLN